MISFESRRRINEQREGITDEQFRDEMWTRRYPFPAPKPAAAWPFVRAANVESKVVNIGKKAAGK